MRPFETHRIEPPGTTVETTVGQLLGQYELMYRLRRMEIAADMLYKAKQIRGFCHLADGQEAVAVGMAAASDIKKDSLIQSYRDHCQHVTRGGTVFSVIAELLGRRDGATRGIGGSMHLYNPKNLWWGGWGIVGSQIPLGAGIALATQQLNKGGVCFTMYGDGAANQGQKYEALNLAALWDLPVVFVCENNHFGMGTAEWRASKSPKYYTRGDYVPGIKADGMDVLAVQHACTFCKQYAVEHGPIILEVDTYRYHGHSMSDPGSTYRTRDEITKTRQARDPIDHARKLLTDAGVDPAALKETDKRVKREVDADVEQAKKSQPPPDHWLWKNVHTKPDNVLLRSVTHGYRQPDFDPNYEH